MRNYKLLYSIGDSISLGYLQFLAIDLFDHYTVAHCPGCGTSDYVLEHLAAWLDGYELDVVLLNSGLHDIGRWPDELSVPLDRYEANLRRIVAHLQGLAGPPRLIWARTTPVIDERHQAVQPFVRRNEDVIAANRVADAVMAEAGLESVDLYGVAVAHNLGEILIADGVHFTNDGYRLLAEAIAGSVSTRP